MFVSSKQVILVVEDDRAIAESIKDLLEENQYHVSVVTNGAEALTYLRGSTPPSLILLDLMMPVMDGFEFREQQLIDPKIRLIPVVVMSADGHVAEKRQRAVASDYIRKPLDIDILLGSIQKHATPPVKTTQTTAPFSETP